MRVPVARSAVAAIALVAAVWFAIALRDLSDRNQGVGTQADNIRSLIGSLRIPSQFARRIGELRSAEYLNPDVKPELDIAGLYLLRSGPGDLQHALRIAEQATRREPDNFDTWLNVYNIQRARGDQAGTAAALAQLARLDPLDATAQ